MRELRPLVSLRVAMLAAIGSLALLTACDGTDPVAGVDAAGDGASGPPSLQRVTTALSADSIVAGGSVTVTCTGFDQYDAPIDAPLAIRAIDASGNPPEGVTVAGDVVTANFAGSFRLICHHTGTPAISDTSPPTLAVQAGEPVEVLTYVLQREVTAGTRVQVACSVRDAAGNRAAADTELRVTPTDGVRVEGTAATFEKTGDFTVTCATVGTGLTSVSPPTLTVKPADLATLETSLSTATLSPGESVTVTCQGKDRYGNDVPLDKVITAPVEGLTGLDPQRLTLTGTQAGVYGVMCIPQEAWVKAATSEAQLEIVPGAPVSLTLSLSPERSVYTVGSRVLLTPEAKDAWDNTITSLDESISIEARHGGTLQETLAPGARVTLGLEGQWTLRARLGAPYNLTAERRVMADASAPVIDITSPTRGQMVTSTGSSMNITGEVRDLTGGLLEVTVQGDTQPITQGATTFSIVRGHVPRHGLNTLEVTARDVSDNFTRTAQASLAAPEWKPAANHFDEGILAHFDKAFIDDGNRGGAPNDLATIFERVVGNIDVSSLLPSPAVTYGGYDVYLKNMRHDRPTIALQPSLDGLLLQLDVNSVSVDVDAQGFIDVGGKVTVSSIEIDMLLTISVTNGVVRVREQATTVEVNGLRIDVHWSINWLVNLFSDTISRSLSDALKAQIVQMVPPLLQDVLKSIELNETFTVPPFFPGMQPLNISLTAKLHNATLSESGLDVALRTRASAARRVNWSTRGSMMRGGCFGVDGGPPVWSTQRRIGAALSLDVLNQLLHALWQGGGLELTMGADAFGASDLSEFGITSLAVDLSARLPPVLTDCGGGLMLQIGELHMDVETDMSGLPLNVSMIVSVETAATLGMQDGSLKLTLEAIPEENILVDITAVESDLFDTNLEVELIDLLRGMVLVKALEQIGGQTLADFPLPEIDLGTLDPSLAGNVITFGGAELTRRRGFLTLSTDP